MASTRVASRYVKSLLGLAAERNVLDKVHSDMQLLASTFGKSRELVAMLKSPVIKHDKKRIILHKLLKGKVNQLTLAIVTILTAKNREPLLPEIANEFHYAFNEYKGIGRASVTTTIAMDGHTRKEIEDMAKKLSNRKEIELEEKVDKDLIGGFILNVGDRQVDASIKSKLKSLKVRFSENPYVKEI